MATFRQDLVYGYDPNSYEQTKNAYQWIVSSVESLGYPNLRVTADFNVSLGSIDCSCTNIKEFTEICYGEPQFHLISFQLSFFSANERLCGILYSRDLVVNTYNKNLLEQIVQALEGAKEKNKEDEVPISITYNGPVTMNKNDGVIINGNNEAPIVNGNNNKMKFETKDTNKTSKSSERFQSIMDNLTANWIWIMLLAIAGAVIAYFQL